MEPLSIFMALVVMALVMFIPGFIISLVLAKEMELQYRIVISFVLGMVPIYAVYMLAKNGFAVFNLSLEAAVLGIFIASGVVTIKDVRKRIISWWITD